VSEVAYPVVVAVAVTGAALALRALLLQWAARALAGPDVRPRLRSLSWDARLASLLWCVVVGAWAGIDAADLPSRLEARLELFVQALVIASVTITVGGLLAAGLTRFAFHRGLVLASTGLSQTIIRASILTMGGLTLLAHVGLTITPILTALGIGGIATALALQDTLSNLLGGFHLLMDRPAVVGDTVRLENGMEGIIEDIGWRSTRIRNMGDDKGLIVVPNAKLAQSILTNRSAYGASDARLHERPRERPP
jgi:small-conductance mechanosensitive channel